MDILTILQNQIVAGVIGVFGGIFVGGIGVWLWTVSGISKAITNHGGEYAGNVVGLFVYNIALKKIKDNNLRKKIAEDLSTAGNDFDKGWDKGLLGEKV